MKRFTLVYNKLYSNSPCVVKFTANKEKSQNFKEFKFEGIRLLNGYQDLINNNKIKYNLSDIDRITNQYNSQSDFYHAMHVYENLYEEFIAYITNGNLRTIKPIYGRDCFKELFDSNAVEKDYVDNARVKKMVDIYCENDSLRRKFIKREYFKSSALTTAVNEIGMYSRAMESNPSLEINESISSVKKEMFNEFRKYHFYREALRCYDDYKKEIELQDKDNLKKGNFKEDEPKTLVKKRHRYQKNVDGQVFFDGFDEE